MCLGLCWRSLLERLGLHHLQLTLCLALRGSRGRTAIDAGFVNVLRSRIRQARRCGLPLHHRFVADARTGIPSQHWHSGLYLSPPDSKPQMRKGCKSLNSHRYCTTSFAHLASENTAARVFSRKAKTISMQIKEASG